MTPSALLKDELGLSAGQCCLAELHCQSLTQMHCSLLVSCCRLSGLYVLERLKSEVIACAVTHYQHLAVQQTRTQTLRRLAAREKRHNNAGPFEVGCTELQSRPARQCH